MEKYELNQLRTWAEQQRANNYSEDSIRASLLRRYSPEDAENVLRKPISFMFMLGSGILVIFLIGLISVLIAANGAKQVYTNLIAEQQQSIQRIAPLLVSADAVSPQIPKNSEIYSQFSESQQNLKDQYQQLQYIADASPEPPSLIESFANLFNGKFKTDVVTATTTIAQANYEENKFRILQDVVTDASFIEAVSADGSSLNKVIQDVKKAYPVQEYNASEIQSPLLTSNASILTKLIIGNQGLNDVLESKINSIKDRAIGEYYQLKYLKTDSPVDDILRQRTVFQLDLTSSPIPKKDYDSIAVYTSMPELCKNDIGSCVSQIQQNRRASGGFPIPSTPLTGVTGSISSVTGGSSGGGGGGGGGSSSSSSSGNNNNDNSPTQPTIIIEPENNTAINMTSSSAVVVSPTWNMILEATPYALIDKKVPLIVTASDGSLTNTSKNTLTKLGITQLRKLPSDTGLALTGYSVSDLPKTAIISNRKSIFLSDNSSLDAILATQLAALANTTVVFSSAGINSSTYVYCIGYSSPVCNKSLTSNQIRQKVLNASSTWAGIIVINSSDADIKDFGGQGLLGPYIASLNGQLLVATTQTTPEGIRADLYNWSQSTTLSSRILTVLGSPLEIPINYNYNGNVYTPINTSDFMISQINVSNASADFHVYSFLDSANLPTYEVSRVYSGDLDATTNMIAASHFSNNAANPASAYNISIIVSDVLADPNGAVRGELLASMFSDLGYNVNKHIDYVNQYASVSPDEYQNKLLAFYDGHGDFDWLGMSSNQLKNLNGINIVAYGCNTCIFNSTTSKNLFCAKAIDEGANSYFGMGTGGGEYNTYSYIDTLFSNYTLGTAYRNFNSPLYAWQMAKNSNNTFVPNQGWTLVGNPASTLNTPAQLPTSSVTKISANQYTLNLTGYALPNQTYTYWNYNNNTWQNISGQATNMFSAYGSDEMIVYEQGLYGQSFPYQISNSSGNYSYPGSYFANLFIHLTNLQNIPTNASVNLPDTNVSGYPTYVKVSNDTSNSAWIYVLYYGFPIPNQKGFFSQNYTLTLT